MKKLHDLKSPVTQVPFSWTCSASTDIRKTFERVLAQQVVPQKNVRELKKVGK